MADDPNTDPNAPGTGTPPEGGDPPAEPAEPQGSATDPPDWEAEAKKWREHARKQEARAKANAEAQKKLEELQKTQMSDQERAVAEAEQRGRQAATSEVGKKIAAAELKAALTGIVQNPAAFVDDLDLSRYVTDTGDVDDDAIKSLAEKYREAFAATGQGNGAGRPDLRQGHRGAPEPSRLSRADLANMKPDEIVKARREGRLQHLLEGQ